MKQAFAFIMSNPTWATFSTAKIIEFYNKFAIDCKNLTSQFSFAMLCVQGSEYDVLLPCL